MGCAYCVAGADCETAMLHILLVSARRIYQAFGFTLVEEQPHHSFGHDLIGQTWKVQFGQPPA